MKKTLTLILLLVAFSSCTTTRYYLESTNKLVDTSSNIELKDASLRGSVYSDEYVTIIPNAEDVSINLMIANNHNSSIRVLWDNAAYIDSRGNAHRIIHLGVKLVDKEKAQVPSVIPKGAQIEDNVVPVDCVEWVGDSWKVSPLEYNEFSTIELAEQELNMYLSYPERSSSKLLLPIEINDKKIEYTLSFIGDDFKISSKKITDSKKSAATLLGTSLGVVLLSLLSLAFI